MRTAGAQIERDVGSRVACYLYVVVQLLSPTGYHGTSSSRG